MHFFGLKFRDWIYLVTLKRPIIKGKSNNFKTTSLKQLYLESYISSKFCLVQLN